MRAVAQHHTPTTGAGVAAACSVGVDHHRLGLLVRPHDPESIAVLTRLAARDTPKLRPGRETGSQAVDCRWRTALLPPTSRGRFRDPGPAVVRRVATRRQPT